MKEIWLSFLIFTVFCCKSIDVQETQNIFPICSRKVADLGKCIKEALNKLRPNIASGKLSPDLIVEPLDPFVIPTYELGNGLFKVTFSDIEIKGGTKFNLVDIKAYFEGDFVKFMPHAEFNKIDIKAKYSFNSLLPLPHTGEISFTLSDVIIHGNGRVRIYKRNGKEYFNIEQAKLMFDSIKLGNIKSSFPVGKPRNAVLLNLLLSFIGDALAKTAYKIFEHRIDKLHLDVANDLFKNVPFDYFFSE